LETKQCTEWGKGRYCGRELANMILKASNACRRSTGRGGCTILEEAREWDKSDNNSREHAEEFNEEAGDPCPVYQECCIEGCHPNELGPEEC